jgi:saccharopine dehydrogenase-like NADP-dependent oxidoreductase
MVGRAIALDLSANHAVTAADRSPDALSLFDSTDVRGLVLDVTDVEALLAESAKYDLVVGAVPGFLGFQTLKTVIQSGKPVVDISFCPEDSLQLQPLAIEHGTIAVVDAGVAPGLDNLILGHHDRSMEVSSFHCVVGGLPKSPRWPFLYKAPFSPVDVIEEYTRPARYVENGHEVVRPALSDPEMVWFEQVGTLESFNTDGLRTLITTMAHIPNMKEKTLRYPGHRELVLALREAGFFSDQPLKTGSVSVKPIDVTSRILFEQWRLEVGEPEFTAMRVTVGGSEEGSPVVYTYDLFDEFDPGSGFTSMARTTGFTCCSMVEFVLGGRITNPGVYPLERIGQMPGGFGLTLRYLSERGVSVRGRKSDP